MVQRTGLCAENISKVFIFSTLPVWFKTSDFFHMKGSSLSEVISHWCESPNQVQILL